MAHPSAIATDKSSRAEQNKPVRRSFTKRVFYFSVRLVSQYFAVLLFRFRCLGRENIPGDGSGLILSTHQSHFDPVLLGISFNERLNYLARRTLFKNRLFGTVISLLDAIELDRDRSGLAGLKETLRRLKRGEKVLIFPEGTRSADGKMAPLKPGFISVARRSKAQVIPVAIAGAYDALPRGAKVPIRNALKIKVGVPIAFSELEALSERQMLELIEQRMRMLDAEVRRFDACG